MSFVRRASEVRNQNFGLAVNHWWAQGDKLENWKIQFEIKLSNPTFETFNAGSELQNFERLNQNRWKIQLKLESLNSFNQWG